MENASMSVTSGTKSKKRSVSDLSKDLDANNDSTVQICTKYRRHDNQLHRELAEAVHFPEQAARVLATAFSSGYSVHIEGQRLRVRGFTGSFIKNFISYKSGRSRSTEDAKLFQIYRAFLKIYQKYQAQSPNGFLPNSILDLVYAVFFGGSCILRDKSENAVSLVYENDTYQTIKWKRLVCAMKMVAFPGAQMTTLSDRGFELNQSIIGVKLTAYYYHTNNANLCQRLRKDGVAYKDINQIQDTILPTLKSFELGTVLALMKYSFGIRDKIPALHAILHATFIQRVLVVISSQNLRDILEKRQFLWDIFFCDYERTREILKNNPRHFDKLLSLESTRFNNNDFFEQIYANHNKVGSCTKHIELKDAREALQSIADTFDPVKKQSFHINFDCLFSSLFKFLKKNNKSHVLRDDRSFLFDPVYRYFEQNEASSPFFDSSEGDGLIFGHTETNVACLVYSMLCKVKNTQTSKTSIESYTVVIPVDKKAPYNLSTEESEIFRLSEIESVTEISLIPETVASQPSCPETISTSRIISGFSVAALGNSQEITLVDPATLNEPILPPPPPSPLVSPPHVHEPAESFRSTIHDADSSEATRNIRAVKDDNNEIDNEHLRRETKNDRTEKCNSTLLESRLDFIEHDSAEDLRRGSIANQSRQSEEKLEINELATALRAELEKVRSDLKETRRELDTVQKDRDKLNKNMRAEQDANREMSAQLVKEKETNCVRTTQYEASIKHLQDHLASTADSFEISNSASEALRVQLQDGQATAECNANSVAATIEELQRKLTQANNASDFLKEERDTLASDLEKSRTESTVGEMRREAFEKDLQTMCASSQADRENARSNEVIKTEIEKRLNEEIGAKEALGRELEASQNMLAELRSQCEKLHSEVMSAQNDAATIERLQRLLANANNESVVLRQQCETLVSDVEKNRLDATIFHDSTEDTVNDLRSRLEYAERALRDLNKEREALETKLQTTRAIAEVEREKSRSNEATITDVNTRLIEAIGEKESICRKNDFAVNDLRSRLEDAERALRDLNKEREALETNLQTTRAIAEVERENSRSNGATITDVKTRLIAAIGEKETIGRENEVAAKDLQSRFEDLYKEWEALNTRLNEEISSKTLVIQDLEACQNKLAELKFQCQNNDSKAKSAQTELLRVNEEHKIAYREISEQYERVSEELVRTSEDLIKERQRASKVTSTLIENERASEQDGRKQLEKTIMKLSEVTQGRDKLKREIDIIETQLVAVRETLANRESDCNNKCETINRLQQERDKLVLELKISSNRLRTTEEKIVNLEAQIIIAKSSLAEARNELNQSNKLLKNKLLEFKKQNVESALETRIDSTKMIDKIKRLQSEIKSIEETKKSLQTQLALSGRDNRSLQKVITRLKKDEQPRATKQIEEDETLHFFDNVPLTNYNKHVATMPFAREDVSYVSVLVRTPALRFKNMRFLDPGATNELISLSSATNLRTFYTILEETRALLNQKDDPDSYRKRANSTRFWNHECAIYPVVVPAHIGQNTLSLFKLIYFLGCIPGVQYLDFVGSQIPVCFRDDSIESTRYRSNNSKARYVAVTRSFLHLDDVAEAAKKVLRWNARSIDTTLYV